MRDIKHIKKGQIKFIDVMGEDKVKLYKHNRYGITIYTVQANLAVFNQIVKEDNIDYLLDEVKIIDINKPNI